MVSLVKASQQDDYPAEIACVISNRPDAEGLQKAQSLGVEAFSIDHKAYKARHDFEQVLQDALVSRNIELVCCAGFMRILSPEFVVNWPQSIMNIHPSLLPKYKGLNTHARAIAAGDAEHGCTVHWVSEELDAGEIICQSRMPIKANDTPDALAARLLPYELELYPKALKKAASTRM